MASFFTEVFSIFFTIDAWSISEKRDARFTVQEIPGGDSFFVDLAGRKPQEISFDMVVSNATTWGQLNTVIGQQGSLSIEGMDTHDAVLTSLSRDRLYADGQTFGKASFVIVDT